MCDKFIEKSMEIKINLKSFIKVPAQLLFVALIAIACKKDEKLPVNVKKETSSLQKSTNEKLIKFLSISLDVSKDEIVFDEEKNEFVIRGQKFNKVEVESNYEGANVYKTTYGE